MGGVAGQGAARLFPVAPQDHQQCLIPCKWTDGPAGRWSTMWLWLWASTSVERILAAWLAAFGASVADQAMQVRMILVGGSLRLEQNPISRRGHLCAERPLHSDGQAGIRPGH